MKTPKAEDTRFPKLTAAILENLDVDQLADVARHGANCGWPGFTYTWDNVQFFNANKSEIIALAKQTSDELGSGGVISLVRSFNCLITARKPNYSEDEIAEAIYTEGGEDVIKEAMAWFALEEIARELNPEI
jgi:hypothetical protein